MQIKRLQTMEDLSARLALKDEVDLKGREISLSNSTPAPHGVAVPWSLTEQLGGGLCCVTWALQDAPEAACWDLAQHGAMLCNVTLHIPEHGCLHVLAGDSPGTWQNMTIAGANSLDVPLTYDSMHCRNHRMLHGL